jgi:F-type H+-transporting ATPase subunit b|tara:strand:- start:579 stop:1052 length:474 start_codon:yes stop_codon:yes gene_type:complete
VNINATLLGQALWFALFIWLTMKYVWPPLQKAMQDRQKQIADGLAAGEKGRQELAASAEKVSQELQKTKEQAMEIISQAEKRSGELIEEAKNQAKLEGERIVTAAKAEIEQEVNRAKELLRAQVASLALAGAEQILQKEINAAAHGDMLQRLESELG